MGADLLKTAVLCAWLLPSLAAAEEQTLQTQRWQVPADGQGLARTSSGSLLGHLDFDVGVWTGYEQNPLTLQDRNAQRLAAVTSTTPPWRRHAQPTNALIASRVASELTAAIGIFRRVELFGSLPVTVYQDRGAGISVASASISPLQTTNLGDLRLGAKIRLLRAPDQVVDLAFIPQLTLPNGIGFRVLELGAHGVRFNPGVDGWARGYTSEGFPTFQPELALSREWNGLFAGVNAGLRLRRPYAIDQLNVGQELLGRAGVGFKGAALAKQVDLMRYFPVEAGVELAAVTSLNTPYLAVPLVTPGASQISFNVPPPVQAHQPSLELSGFLGADVQGVHPYLGASLGVVAGYGTPDWRILGGFRFATDAGRGVTSIPPDRDHDGTLDDGDLCPDLPGPPELHGCPATDDDHDGIINVLDRCPNEPETINQIEDDDGCPEGPMVVAPVEVPAPPSDDTEVTPDPDQEDEEDAEAPETPPEA